jgi:hypothetical protein
VMRSLFGTDRWACAESGDRASYRVSAQTLSCKISHVRADG